MIWFSWLIIGSAAIVLSLNAAYLYLFPRGDKRWLRFFSSAAIFYVGVLYILATATELVTLPDAGPLLIRPAIVVLIGLLGAEALFDLIRGR